MDKIKAYYDGSVFVPLGPVNAKPNQQAIVTILGEVGVINGGEGHSAFFGALTHESYIEIMNALKDTERVDEDEW